MMPPLYRPQEMWSSPIQVLTGLQAECDESGVRLLQRFMQHRTLEQYIRDIRRHRSQHTADAGQPTSSFDPRQVGSLLNDNMLWSAAELPLTASS